MDIIIETKKGVSFTIEIGYFDTVKEIKEKIQKHREIPISEQSLVLNGKTLDDDGNTETCSIFHNSRMLLILPSDTTDNSPEKSKDKPQQQQQQQQQQQSPIYKKTQLLCKLPTSNGNSHLTLEVDLNDSVLQLKDKLQEKQGIPTSRVALYVNGNNELQDHRYLREYELTDGSEIDVSIRPSLTPISHGMSNTPSVTATASKKLRVTVLPKCGPKKVFVDVNPTDKVQVLRKELEKLQQRVNLQLPPEGYFFIFKQNVMEERESFMWHNVRNGDVIEIFNGSVTGGS